jgi:uncharacterized repeat protein (TIGR01451 family)
MNSFWDHVAASRLSRQASRWAASALVVTACSCSTMQRPLARNAVDPFLDDDVKVPVVARPTASVRPNMPGAVPGAGRIQQAQFETGAASGERQTVDAAIERTIAEPRLPEVALCPCIDESPAAFAHLYSDEYLCDGGDRDLPIHYDDYQMLGLDTEDAAIEFRDDRGNRRVKPTNRVCIYAPRFASVTAISEPIEDVGGGRPRQAVVAQSGIGFVNHEGSFAHHQRDAAERLLSRSRGSGLKNSDVPEALDRPIAIQGHVHTTTPVEDFGFLRTGQFHQTDEPRLAASIQSAVTWTRDQNPVIIAQSDQAGELTSRFKEQELVGQENRANGKGKLRIVKLADKQMAQPGDVVTFTIRFDNIGDLAVHDVVIVDNLTPRLEYVDDSATCDRDGRLVEEDNGEGSLLLRWELDDPLAGRTGGVVTFKARVR